MTNRKMRDTKILIYNIIHIQCYYRYLPSVSNTLSVKLVNLSIFHVNLLCYCCHLLQNAADTLVSVYYVVIESHYVVIESHIFRELLYKKPIFIEQLTLLLVLNMNMISS